MLNGKKLKQLMEQRYTRAEILALAMDVDLSTVYRWCSGDRTQVAPHMLVRLKAYFKCDDTDLLGLPGIEEDPK